MRSFHRATTLVKGVDVNIIPSSEALIERLFQKTRKSSQILYPSQTKGGPLHGFLKSPDMVPDIFIM